MNVLASDRVYSYSVFGEEVLGNGGEENGETLIL